MRETRKTFCGLCHPRCGLLLHFEDGRAVAVEGDPDHPISKGAICARGRLMVEHLNHPDRLNHPLKRVGERGGGEWQRVSWDQALDEVAGKLERLRATHGPETLAFTHGTHRTYEWDARRFYNRFGSPNIAGVNQICMCPSLAVEYATYGGMAMSDIANARCVVVCGRAPSQSDPLFSYKQILAARRNGARIVVIDPRRTAEARLADLWLPIRPGTDAALMLGWIRWIVENDLHDAEFVREWTVGFDDLVAAVAPYTPERVAAITWLSVEQVVESARMYATNRPAAFTWGYGIDKQGVNATQAARARSILRAITGNLDVPGGDLLGSMAEPLNRMVQTQDLEGNEAISAEQRAKQLGADRYPFFGFPGWERNLAAHRRLPPGTMPAPSADKSCLAHARSVFDAAITGEPYPVTAMISQASNPALSFPDSPLVIEALRALELYVVMDYYLTPSAALADYVFPAASTVERSEMWSSPAFCVPCPKGLEPLHERRDDYQLWRGLGVRLGQADHWPWETVEEVFDHQLAPIGLTWAELVERGGVFGRPRPQVWREFGFGTPSGKVELRSQTFEELGAAPLPVYRDPYPELAEAETSEAFPLVLITGSRFMPMYHSEQRQIPAARAKVPDPLVTLHPDTAAGLGLAEGDWARVVTEKGAVRFRVQVSDAIDPRMVDAQHGWWFPEREETDLFDALESNANVLCPLDPERCSPEIGSWPHSGLLCRVEPEQAAG